MAAAAQPGESRLPLERPLLVRIHELLVKARALEERLIQMYKQGHGYFWIGGPGEEAFNVPLGLLINKGEGPAYDYLHFHYRQGATLVAMGENPIGQLRQMKNTATDPYSGGRNFASHFSIKKWNVVPVSSPMIAETAKLHENTFRAVNIALANELALMCDRMGISAWEVIEAASTKPFGFLPHHPGPGLGGDCIPVVPHFLAWRLREYGYSAQLIAAAHDINANMPHHVVQRAHSGRVTATERAVDARRGIRHDFA